MAYAEADFQLGGDGGSSCDSDDMSSEGLVGAFGDVGGAAYGQDEEFTFGEAGQAYAATFTGDESFIDILGGHGYGSGEDSGSEEGSGEGPVVPRGSYGPYDGGYLGDDDDSSESSDDFVMERDFFPEPSSQSDSKLDWNGKYQALLCQADSLEKYSALSSLARDFNYAASTFGSIIINEICLQPDAKTVKPIDVGGVAGGDKYIASGVLYKFALDSAGIYGSHEAAMKVAGHELRGVVSIHNCGIPGLLTPLMALIDMKGFRLIAISLLPIAKHTLVYGSADAAVTVHDDEPEVTAMMQQLGRNLNLAEHQVNDKRLVGPGDIEIHKTNEGAFYAIDASRMFPPEAPLKDNWRTKGWFLYRLLRPELVGGFQHPLSSDCFTRFQIADPNRTELNSHCEMATVELNNVRVPALAAELDGKSKEFIKACRLNEEFHRAGVNVRKMGVVRLLCSNKLLRKRLLTEMIARVCKCILRRQLRDMMLSLKTPRDEPFVQIVLTVMNLVIGEEEPVKARAFWKMVKEQLVTKFDGGLTPKELKPTYLLRQMKKVNINEEIQYAFEDEDVFPNFTVTEADVESLTARVKQMGVTYSAEARALSMKAEAPGVPEAARERLQKMASQRYRDALSTNTTSPKLLRDWCLLLAKMVKGRVSGEWFTIADGNYKFLSKTATDDAELLACWGHLHWIQSFRSDAKARLERCAELWGQALALNPKSINGYLLEALEGTDTLADTPELSWARCDSHKAYHLVKVLCNCVSDKTDRTVWTADLKQVFAAGLFKEVRYVQFRNCSNVQDSAVTAVLQSCPKLQVLDVQECPKVSEDPLPAKLMEYCPNMACIHLPQQAESCIDITSLLLDAPKVHLLPQPTVHPLGKKRCSGVVPVGATQLLTSDTDQHMFLWDLNTCKQVREFSHAFDTDEASVQCMAYDPVDHVAYTVWSDEGQLSRWNLETGEKRDLCEVGTMVDSMYIEGDRLYIVEDSVKVFVVDIRTDIGQMVKKVKIKEFNEFPAIDVAGDVVIGGNYTNASVIAYSMTEKKKIMFKLRGHRAAVNGVAISPDRKWIWTGGDDKLLLKHDYETHACVAAFGPFPDDIQTLHDEGGVVYVVVRRNSSLHVVDYEGRQLVVYTNLRVSHMAVCNGVLITDGTAVRMHASNPLHHAVAFGTEERVKEVLGTHPELSTTTDYKGYTVLHLAALRGEVGIVKAVQGSAVDPAATTLHGMTAKQLAQDAEARELNEARKAERAAVTAVL